MLLKSRKITQLFAHVLLIYFLGKNIVYIGVQNDKKNSKFIVVYGIKISNEKF